MKRAALLVLLLAGCATTPPPSTRDAASLHKRLLSLDTHLDVPIHFGRPGWDFGARQSFEAYGFICRKLDDRLIERRQLKAARADRALEMVGHHGT